MTVNEKQFDALVQAAFEDLPEVYRQACHNLTIRTEALASREVMAALGLGDPHQLLGLYHGINLARKSTFDVPMLPDEVIIYRTSIKAYAEAKGYALDTVVRHVLIHEIGHHFGFSDDDMEAIEQS